MKKEDLIKFCKYYKGECDNPYTEHHSSLMWDYECVWVERTIAEDMDFFSPIITEYTLCGLAQFNILDDTPTTLKALLFNRFGHWSSGAMFEIAEPFKKWYLEHYL